MRNPRDQQICSRLNEVRGRLDADHEAYRQKLELADKYYFYGVQNLRANGSNQKPEHNKTEDLTENFGAYALHKLAGYLLGMTFNPQSKWGQIVTDKDYRQLSDAQVDWLNDATRALMRYLAEPQTRFYTALAAAMTECIVGQGMLYVDMPVVDGAKRLKFSAFPMVSISHSLDGYGDLSAVSRVLKMDRGEILTRWKHGVDLEYPDDFIINTPSNLKKEETIFHMILPNETYDQYIREEERETLPQKQKHQWSSYYYIHTQNILLEERSLDYMPYIPLRFFLRAGSSYGEGPGIWALPDVIELVRMGRDESIGRQLSGLPPMQEEPGVFNDALDLSPFARNVRNRPLIEADAISPLLPPSTLDFRSLMEGKEFKKQQIGQIFYLDRLGTPVKNAEMREVEVLGRQQDNITELVPFMARLDAEVADPVMRIVLKYLIETERLPSPPQGLKPLLRYQSQLSKAQLIASNREIIQLLGTDLQPVITLQQDVLDYFDFSRLLKEIVNPYVVDTRFLRSEEEVAALRQQRAEMEQQAQLQAAQASQLQAQSVAAKNFAQANEIQAGMGGMG